MEYAKVTPIASQNLTSTSDNQAPNGYGGGEGGPPMINERMTRLEDRMDSLEGTVFDLRGDVRELRNEVGNMRWWIVGTCLTTVLGVIAVVIAFGQFQASWLQNSVAQTRESLEKNSDRNWEATQKALEKIESIQLRLERMDALHEKATLQPPSPDVRIYPTADTLPR